jgi:hypothetical protein
VVPTTLARPLYSVINSAEGFHPIRDFFAALALGLHLAHAVRHLRREDGSCFDQFWPASRMQPLGPITTAETSGLNAELEGET